MKLILNNFFTFFQFRCNTVVDNIGIYVTAVCCALLLICVVIGLENKAFQKYDMDPFLYRVIRLFYCLQVWGINVLCIVAIVLAQCQTLLTPYVLFDAGLISLVLSIVYKFVDWVFVTLVYGCIKLFTQNTRKTVARNVQIRRVNKYVNENLITEIDNIVTEFTRDWLKKKIQKEPLQSRYQIITKHEEEYIKELQKTLPASCDSTKTAKYYYTYYCKIWN